MKKRKKQRKHVVFVLPTYTGQMHVETCATVYGEGRALEHRGDKFSVIDDVGSADIAWSRAVAVAKFLASDGTHLMFIDADVSGPEGCVRRLLEYDIDFVSSVYPKRQEPIEFPMRFLPDAKGPILDNESGLLEVGGVAGGFCMMSREMLRKMVVAYPSLEFICNAAPLGRAVALFDNWWYVAQDGRHRLSEDYAFCERWRECGGKVLVDPEITLGHTGYKRFTGRLLDYMKPAEDA